jgi:hypothetical protein
MMKHTLFDNLLGFCYVIALFCAIIGTNSGCRDVDTREDTETHRATNNLETLKDDVIPLPKTNEAELIREQQATQESPPNLGGQNRTVNQSLGLDPSGITNDAELMGQRQTFQASPPNFGGQNRTVNQNLGLDASGGSQPASPFVSRPPAQPAICGMCDGRGHTGVACRRCNGTGLTDNRGGSCTVCNGTKFLPCGVCMGRGTR